MDLLGLDAAARGGEDVCEWGLFEDAPEGNRGCQGGVGCEEEGEGWEVHPGKLWRRSGMSIDAEP